MFFLNLLKTVEDLGCTQVIVTGSETLTGLNSEKCVLWPQNQKYRAAPGCMRQHSLSPSPRAWIFFTFPNWLLGPELSVSQSQERCQRLNTPQQQQVQPSPFLCVCVLNVRPATMLVPELEATHLPCAILSSHSNPELCPRVSVLFSPFR